MESPVIEFLKQVKNEGHTCFPYDAVITHVTNKIGTKASIIKEHIAQLRSLGMVVFTSKPFPLIALRSVMETDRFIFNTLRFLETVEIAHDNSSIRDIIDMYETSVGRKITDIQLLVILSIFYEPGSLLIEDIGGMYYSNLIDLLTYCCNVKQVYGLFLTRKDPVKLVSGDYTIHTTYSQFINDNSAHNTKFLGKQLILFLADASMITSSELQDILIRLTSSIKLVFIGNPDIEVDQCGNMFYDILDTKVIKCITNKCYAKNVFTNSGNIDFQKLFEGEIIRVHSSYTYEAVHVRYLSISGEGKWQDFIVSDDGTNLLIQVGCDGNLVANLGLDTRIFDCVLKTDNIDEVDALISNTNHQQCPVFCNVVFILGTKTQKIPPDCMTSLLQVASKQILFMSYSDHFHDMADWSSLTPCRKKYTCLRKFLKNNYFDDEF